MVRRQPNGQPARQKAETPQERAAQMPHRALVASDAAHDPACETPLGCLYVIGAITEREYRAAEELAGIVRRYSAAMSSVRAPGSISGIMEPRERTSAEIIPSDAASRIKIHDDVRRFLEHEMGLRGWNLMASVVSGLPLPARSFSAIQRGLVLLANYLANWR
jgi:hypothetical protein